MENGLNDMQVRFCEEYVLDWHVTNAAKRAGYSERSAHSIGSDLLKKHEIREYIEFLKTDTARLAGVSLLRNVQELRNIAYSSIAHLHNKWIDLKRFEDLTEEQKSAIESIDTKSEIAPDGTKTVQYVKIKLHSKIKAIDLMNKMLGFNAPKEIKLDVEVSELTPQERASRIKELTERVTKLTINTDGSN